MLALNKKQKTIKIITITVIIIIFLMAKTKAKAINKTDKKLNPLFYIDPFIGTDAHGHTFPGATTPFGMVQLSPDTDTKGWGHCSGYHYKDSSIMGFSHTHLSGTGCMDYGNILFMPIVGEIKTEPGPKNDPSAGYRSSFKHKTEKANPGYYSVFLDDYKVGVELTATKRVGVHRYTFPYSKRAHILIDLIHRIGGFATEAEVNIIDNQTIQSYSYCDQSGGGWCASGVKYRVFFVAKFSKPFSSFGTWDNKGIYLENRRAKIIYKKMGLKRSPDTTSNETAMNFQEKRPKLGAFLTFNTKKNEKIVVKVGTSFSSVEGARKNLEKEVADSDFDAIKLKAKALWNKELTKLEIKGGAKKDLRTFYTALYHCLIAPNIFSDIDGTYIGIDQKMHKIKDYPHYSVFSLWDTFRAEHPLFALLYPKYDLEMLKSLLDKYDQGGWLPIWELACNYTNCMIGDHSIPIIVDAYTKGIRDFDIDKAYKAMKKGAMELPPASHPFAGRIGLKEYKKIGYVPADKYEQSASRTLEYAYDDFCLAQIAKALGKEKDYKHFMQRASFYKNIFDKNSGFMRGKNIDGSLAEPFDPLVAGFHSYFTEANAWQYLWFVPHDVNGLIELLGGKKRFIEKLDQLFNLPVEIKPAEGEEEIPHDISGLIGQYAHGNEPSHHIAYLYNYAGKSWKTQKTVYQIIKTLYSDRPDGLCGNEDVGQMSAWYIFSAMGFYPSCPGKPIYGIGTAIFTEVKIKLDDYWGKKTFTITAKNLSNENKYIQKATLNGKPLNNPLIKHSDIINGGELVLEMGKNPTNWGSNLNTSNKQ